MSQDADLAKQEEKVFNHWLRKHNINVPQNADINVWKANVLKAFKEHEAHNDKYRKGEELFERAINHMSHMTEDEIKAGLLGFQRPADPGYVLPVVDKEATKDLPAYWNWVDKGIVHPPQDQKQCGSC